MPWTPSASKRSSRSQVWRSWLRARSERGEPIRDEPASNCAKVLAFTQMTRPRLRFAAVLSVFAGLALFGSACVTMAPEPRSPRGYDPHDGRSSPSSGGPVSASVSTVGVPRLYGKPFTGGQFHLGPVDYEETKFHNACAPGTKYAPAVRAAEGKMLAGLWGGLPNVAGHCDACILVTTERGKSATLRVVTYGETTPNSIDVSPEAFAILDSGHYPRAMTWQSTDCPDTGNAIYEMQSGAHEYWTSLWVRNVRVPIGKVEVKSKNHPTFVALQRGGDGTLTDSAGFGKGPFTLRVTSVDGRAIEDSFEWPSGGVGGKLLPSSSRL